jgi:hypothetical protein
MTDAPALYCCICERPIRGMIRGDVLPDAPGEDPPPDTRVFLCPTCAAKPVLVAAFREGRARLAGEGAA